MGRSIDPDARYSVKSSGVTTPGRLVGTREADAILASGHVRCVCRPDIWKQAIDSPLKNSCKRRRLWAQPSAIIPRWAIRS